MMLASERAMPVLQFDYTEASAPSASTATSGLPVSTFSTLILVPAIYQALYSRRQGVA
jgi:multidrug efflux pump subunit AcrB